MTELTKLKISAKLRGRKHTARQKWKMALAHKGRTLSKEHKKAITDGMVEYWKKKKRDEKSHNK